MTTSKKKITSSKTAANKEFDLKKALMSFCLKELNDWDLSYPLDRDTKEEITEELDFVSSGLGQWFFENYDEKQVALNKLTPAERKLLGF